MWGLKTGPCEGVTARKKPFPLLKTQVDGRKTGFKCQAVD